MKFPFVLLFSLFSIGYSESISGTVRDKTTGEPLQYANIVILETDIGTATDNNGYYILPSIDKGDYILKVMMIGYASFEKDLLIDGKNIRLDIELFEETINIDAIKVSAERMRFEKKVDVSRVNISRNDIRMAPAFIESDVFRTLQLLPSVSSSNDFNAALIVRGGSPDENLILLDGTEIYNPYHIGGVFSTFNSDMISDSEFLAGGYPANYGGRLSSVLKITAREGDSKNGRLSENNPIKKYWDFSKGNGNVSLLSSKVLTEGALYRGAWMFSARRTYFDKFVDLYYDLKDDTSPFNYYFWDTHFKANTSINNTNRLIYSQFSGKDNLYINIGGDDFPGIDFDWDWGNSTKNLTWRYIPNSNYLIVTALSKTRYNFNVNFAVDFNPNVNSPDTLNTINLGSESTDLELNIDNIVEDIDLNQNIKIVLNNNITIDGGWQIKQLALDFERNFAGEKFNLTSNPKINSLFINVIFNPFPIFYVNTGLRYSKSNRYPKSILDPRISIKYTPIPDLALKFSTGTFTQFLYTTNEEEELLRIVDFWQPIPNGKKPQQADHWILGAEYWISNGNTISIETYFKDYSNVYDLNPAREPNDENTFAIAGTAEAYGIEFLYRYVTKKSTGWLSYAYSNIKRKVDLNSDGIIHPEQEIYPAKYDKPHSFSMLYSYKINEKYTLGITTVFASGQTYTPVIGKVYQAGQYGSLENPYSDFGNINGKRNSGRYPSYFRIDLSLSKKSTLFGLDSQWKFQIINLTNNYNVFFYNWNHNASPSQVSAYSMFPFIFSFGWEFNF